MATSGGKLTHIAMFKSILQTSRLYVRDIQRVLQHNLVWLLIRCHGKSCHQLKHGLQVRATTTSSHKVVQHVLHLSAVEPEYMGSSNTQR